MIYWPFVDPEIQIQIFKNAGDVIRDIIKFYWMDFSTRIVPYGDARVV